jgi:hypothetical protein
VTYLECCVRRLSQAGLAVGSWLSVSGTAWAADGDGPSAGTYVFPYFVIILLVGIGLTVACLPSKRRDKAKADDYVEKKLM